MNQKKSNQHKVYLNEVSIFWEKNNSVLENISLELKSGELFVVLGEIGSGKTSFLLALASEIPLIKGDLIVNG